MTNKKFTLEKSPKKKGMCPNCGHAGTFRYYENLSREYGICERKNNCSYVKDPHKEPYEKQKTLLNETSVIPTKRVEEPIIIRPEGEYIEKLISAQKTNFHVYATTTLKIPEAHLKKWLVGGQGNATVFIMSNSEGVINAKFIAYNSTGNRIKNTPPYSLKADPGKKYDTCLYGLHLLSENKTICLVESEKTAVIASYIYPQFDWLATGGSNGLTVNKVQVLKNRNILYLSDADKAGKDNSSVTKLSNYGIKHRVIDLFPDKNDGYDIADAIRDGLRPVILPKDELIEITASAVKNIEVTKYECLEEWGYFEKNGRYYIQEKYKNNVKDVEVSNFTMQWLYRMLDGSKDPPYLMKFIKTNGESFDLEIRATELLNQAVVSAIIMNHGCTFTGNGNTFKKIIASLHQNSKEASFVNTLGQSKTHDFYAFYNGLLSIDGQFTICNAKGIVSFADNNFYIPSGREESKNDSLYSDDRKFYLKDGGPGIAEFIEKIYKIYDINGLIGFTYTVASIFRDIIFEETSFFPFLFLYGGKGSGKSTYLNFFMKFFGEPQPETTENSTDKAIERKFSQINNNIQYIKEFSTTFEQKITNILKNAYDGIGYSRAQMSNNNRTQTLEVKSGMFIDGNYFPTKDDALFSRLIFLIWNPQHTEESKREVHGLADMLSAGNGNLFREIYINRSLLKSSFGRVYRETITELKSKSRASKILFTEREISHLALLAAVFKLVILNQTLNESAYEMFILRLFEGSKTQQEIAKGIDDVNKFFEEIQTLYADSVIRDQSHFIREEISQFDYLFINYNPCYNLFAEYLKKRSDYNIPSKQELKQKLEISASQQYAYANSNEKYFQKKFDGKNSRCLVFEVKAGTFDLYKT